MARGSAREKAFHALRRWRSTREFADAIIHQALAAGDLTPQDGAFAQELFYGVIRNLSLLDFFIAALRKGKLEHSSRDLLRLGIYQLFHLAAPAHAAVFETVEIAPRKTRPLINAVLRAALKSRDLLQAKAATAALSIQESHPQFLVQRWEATFNQAAAAALCRWNNQPAPIYARINTLRISKQEFLRRNSSVCPIPQHPLFVKCAALPVDAIARGECYIQDPSTALAVELLNPLPGDTILDACAAPGGKTSYVAALTQNKAVIFATDSQADRVRQMRDNLQRMAVQVRELSQIDWSKNSRSSFSRRGIFFDRILVDAPCTNTGVMRRRVDVRWRLAPSDFKRMHERQSRIVRDVIQLLKPGGALVYSTCSLEREENESVIERIHAEFPSLALEESRAVLPFREHFDGAFAARFRLTRPGLLQPAGAMES